MENEKKEYRDERFEFLLFVNENLVCKRSFKIFDFIEGSMHTYDFKTAMDGVVKMIDDDLKSKARTYMWYVYNPEDESNVYNAEFQKPTLEPWESTFKLVITDNKKEVYTRIWDGYGYPRAIREKVDLTNKNVRVITKDGVVYNYNKDTFFEENKDRLSYDQTVLKAMIGGRADMVFKIIKAINNACSSSEDGNTSIKDYTVSEIYANKENIIDENGEVVGTKTDKKQSKKYYYSLNLANKKYIAEWGASVSDKTKEYLKTLY